MTSQAQRPLCPVGASWTTRARPGPDDAELLHQRQPIQLLPMLGDLPPATRKMLIPLMSTCFPVGGMPSSPRWVPA